MHFRIEIILKHIIFLLQNSKAPFSDENGALLYSN